MYSSVYTGSFTVLVICNKSSENTPVTAVKGLLMGCPRTDLCPCNNNQPTNVTLWNIPLFEERHVNSIINTSSRTICTTGSCLGGCVQSWGDYSFGVQGDFIQSQSVKHTSDVRLLVVIDMCTRKAFVRLHLKLESKSSPDGTLLKISFRVTNELIM